ncbi:MAG: hypothetical protein RLZZ618_2129 [Pseudomonadota bacterium]|jgi:uncharacterized protein (UPF0276 family)
MARFDQALRVDPHPDAVRAHVGIGLRHPHHAQLLTERPPLGFIEVHSENFFAEGGAALATLLDARACYELSLHGVGLSLGAAAGLDAWHLDQLARLVERTSPVRVSDHACFARAPRTPGGPVLHANDLLPVAFTQASLDIMAANVDQVQARLKRPLLVENLSAYVAWADADMDEPDFFNELTRRTGCGVLLDVNNLVVNSLNDQRRLDGPRAPVDAARAATSACRWIDRLRPGSVGEIHLAGYADLGDIVIDDHGSRVHAPVWTAYRHALRHCGTVPTLIEWDTDLPSLSVLIDEADRAAACQAESCLVPA